MLTTIIGGHVVERPAHELTDAEQVRIVLSLAEQGIHVVTALDLDDVLHLWATEPTSTVQEVRAIAAFAGVTDARLAFHRHGGQGGS